MRSSDASDPKCPQQSCGREGVQWWPKLPWLLAPTARPDRLRHFLPGQVERQPLGAPLVWAAPRDHGPLPAHTWRAPRPRAWLRAGENAALTGTGPASWHSTGKQGLQTALHCWREHAGRRDADPTLSRETLGPSSRAHVPQVAHGPHGGASCRRQLAGAGVQAGPPLLEQRRGVGSSVTPRDSEGSAIATLAVQTQCPRPLPTRKGGRSPCPYLSKGSSS